MSLESELNDLEPKLREKIAAIIDDCPHKVGITSSWRSRAEQQRLYDGWKARKPGFNPANPPGRSKHENVGPKGEPASQACDLSYPGGTKAINWVHDNAADYGLHFPIAKENWHAESNGQPYRKKDDVMNDAQSKKQDEIHKMLTQLTAPRRADKKDIDPNKLSLADLYTLIEKKVT